MTDLSEIIRRLLEEHGAAAVVSEINNQKSRTTAGRPKGTTQWSDIDRVIVFSALETERRLAGRHCSLDRAAKKLMQECGGTVSVTLNSKAAAKSTDRLRGIYYEGKAVLAGWGEAQQRRYDAIISNSVRIRSKTKQK